MQEIWKDIYFIENGIEWDYRGLYQVSNYGNVKSLNYNGTKKEKIMKAIKNKHDYCTINLYKNGKIKVFRIHRLVAHMFCNGYEDGLEPDHINTIRDDNRAENLVWKTRKENNNNPLTRVNKSKAQSGENNSMYKSNRTFESKNSPNAKHVNQYNLDGELIKVWYCVKEISYELGFSYGMLKTTLQGKRKTYEYKGFIWKYVD